MIYPFFSVYIYCQVDKLCMNIIYDGYEISEMLCVA